MIRHILIASSVLAIAAGVGCSSSGSDAQDACRAESVDQLKELIVVDQAVIGDRRASNAENGPWSFRHLVEELTPPGMTPTSLIVDWARGWGKEARVGTSPVAGRPLVQAKLVCPWLRRTPSNACNDDCSTCTAQELDFGKAPFRLLAIVNRSDLHRTNDLGEPIAGEGRLVYGFTDGPGDDPASAPLGLSVILEYELVGATRQEWASRWHALGKFAAYDEPFRVALEQLTNQFTARGVKPAGVGGSGISQVRTNEREFDWQWEMREFKLGEAGLFVAPLENTPPSSLNNSAPLRDFLVSNRDTVLEQKHELPASLRGGVIQQGFKWSISVDEPLRVNFAKQTCNGCHQSEELPVDSNFHVSPFRTGADKLSKFMHDVNNPGNDELSRRSVMFQNALCGR